MAYDSKNLSVLAYANGFTLWHYFTEDTAADVDNTGYFLASIDMLRVGDMILANTGMGDGGTPVAGVFVVNENDGSTIDIDDLTTFGGTDTTDPP